MQQISHNFCLDFLDVPSLNPTRNVPFTYSTNMHASSIQQLKIILKYNFM